jgi:hypothetical protein
MISFPLVNYLYSVDYKSLISGIFLCLHCANNCYVVIVVDTGIIVMLKSSRNLVIAVTSIRKVHELYHCFVYIRVCHFLNFLCSLEHFDLYSILSF